MRRRRAHVVATASGCRGRQSPTGHQVPVLGARAAARPGRGPHVAKKLRAAFPDLNFCGTADLIAEGDYLVGQWKGGGTHTGDAFGDMPYGPLRTAHHQGLTHIGSAERSPPNQRY
jgi:hypothetical protein